MATPCAVPDCPSGRGGDAVALFGLPDGDDGQDQDQDGVAMREFRLKRWLRAIHRDEEESTEDYRVCSRHFYSGKPAAPDDTRNLDWVPSINLTSDPEEEEDEDEGGLRGRRSARFKDHKVREKRETAKKKVRKEISLDPIEKNEDEDGDANFNPDKSNTTTADTSPSPDKSKRNRKDDASTSPDIKKKKLQRLQAYHKREKRAALADMEDVDWVPGGGGSDNKPEEEVGGRRSSRLLEFQEKEKMAEAAKNQKYRDDHAYTKADKCATRRKRAPPRSKTTANGPAPGPKTKRSKMGLRPLNTQTVQPGQIGQTAARPGSYVSSKFKLFIVVGADNADDAVSDLLAVSTAQSAAPLQLVEKGSTRLIEAKPTGVVEPSLRVLPTEKLEERIDDIIRQNELRLGQSSLMHQPTDEEEEEEEGEEEGQVAGHEESGSEPQPHSQDSQYLASFLAQPILD